MTTTLDDANVYPDYLREEFFKHILKQLFGDVAKLSDLQVIPQKSFGNYCSDIYRVRLKYELHDKKSKEKAITRTEQRVLNVLVKDLFDNLSSISNEQFMYAQVLPEINKTLLSCALKPVSPT